MVCTKAGFLTPGAVNPATLRDGDVIGGMHAMAPDFLADQIDRSRANLGLETLDVFYLHNPETQIGHMSREDFDIRIRAAFARLERIAAQGQNRLLRNGHLGRVSEIVGRPGSGAASSKSPARSGGPEHRFRFIQLPFNLAMTEACSQRPEGREAAFWTARKRAASR